MTLMGGWWLLILLAITGGLFLWGMSRRTTEIPARQGAGKSQTAKGSKQSVSTKPIKPSAELVELDELLATYYPTLITSLQHNRIIAHNSKHNLLIMTIDKNNTMGSRKLGDALIVNFQRVPSLEELHLLLAAEV